MIESFSGAVFEKRARQLLKTMFTLGDVHWIAATLNPRTHMVKTATGTERAHAYSLVRTELEKIIEVEQSNDSRSVQSATIANPSTPSKKKLKSYTAMFDDDIDFDESSNTVASSGYAHQELEVYLQMKLTKSTFTNDDNNNPLLLWEEQKRLLPNLSKLAKKTFCILASSAAIERTFSSAGIIIFLRRTSLNPSTVDNLILI